MSYAAPSWIEVMSRGRMSVAVDPPTVTEVEKVVQCGYIKMTFYKEVTISDRSINEQALYSDVSGKLEIDSYGRVETEQRRSKSTTYVFYPGKILIGIDNGIKAAGNGSTFIIDHVDSYEDHQEIYLKAVNA